MNEQTKSFKEKNDMVQEYIKKVNPYKPLEPLIQGKLNAIKEEVESIEYCELIDKTD